MNVTASQLEKLIAELQQANAELADATRPLSQLADLNEEQRDLVRKQIYAGLARWRGITDRIDAAMGITSDDHGGEEKQ
jgi:hypothetical protein